jgi:NAD(P)-dependent dehydrogenase (short-subunit alcohol dehydrogenase family)
VDDQWDPPDLRGRVAVVTGGTRGVGRGIAEVLRECGATVLAFGRDICDVGDDDAVRRLFDRVAEEHGQLDLLVNNAVGWGTMTETPTFWSEPPWRAPVSWWDDNFRVGVRSHHVATMLASPLLLSTPGAAVVFTSERQPAEPGLQELVMDLRATVVARMALLWSLHLRPHRVASLVLYPGWSRTEEMDAAFERGDAQFADWSRDRYVDETASIHYAGRAAAMLAADDAVLERSGGLITAHEAATAYGFTDVDGRRPDPL